MRYEHKAPYMAAYRYWQWCSQCPVSAVGSMLGPQHSWERAVCVPEYTPQSSSLHLLSVPWVNQSTPLDYSGVFQRKQKMTMTLWKVCCVLVEEGCKALALEMPSSTVLRAMWESKCCGCVLLFALGWIFPLQWKGATIAAINRFLIQLLVSSCLTDTPQGASYAACSEKWKVLCIYSVNSEISDVVSSAHFHNYLCGTTSCSHDGNGKGKKGRS